MEWTQRILPHTDLAVGPCAWRLAMLAGVDRGYVREHPSLIVVDPTDTDALLEQAGPYVHDYPVLLGVAEPAFARQLEGVVRDRMRRLGRDQVEALVLHVDDPAEVKSGGMLQTMFALREAGVVRHLGLAHHDVRAAQWLAENAAVRLLGVDFSLENPSARYGALPSALEFGMSAFSLVCPSDERGLRYALAESQRVLAVLDQPIPAGLTSMSLAESEQVWNDYKQTNPPPPALERGKPPTFGD